MLYCATITAGSTQLSLALLLFVILTFCTKLRLMLLKATENTVQKERRCVLFQLLAQSLLHLL